MINYIIIDNQNSFQKIIRKKKTPLIIIHFPNSTSHLYPLLTRSQFLKLSPLEKVPQEQKLQVGRLSCISRVKCTDLSKTRCTMENLSLAELGGGKQ